MKDEAGFPGRTRVVRCLLFVMAGLCVIFLVASALAGRGQRRPLPKNNSACLVCHINLEKETLVSVHLKKGISCARCHGVSYEHMNDEEAATKPDLLFGRTEVDAFCRKCHSAHRKPAAAKKFLAEWKGKRRPHRRLIRPGAICTDCHGEHRVGQGGRH